ncbi:hypothetical protein SDC9_165990 [bioreactor metagenome]|uniref:Uncharacterized protein n=1 Tax=bioreactor metagenome TaxID=1076179 RepID=A0A645FYC4_9ZZZZ
MSGMESEASCMGKGVQYPCIAYKGLESGPIFPLVQKIAGFLAVFNIYKHFDFVFYNFNLGVKRALQKSLLLLHTFQFSDLHIISFIYAFRVQYLV